MVVIQPVVLKKKFEKKSEKTSNLGNKSECCTRETWKDKNGHVRVFSEYLKFRFLTDLDGCKATNILQETQLSEGSQSKLIFKIKHSKKYFRMQELKRDLLARLQAPYNAGF